MTQGPDVDLLPPVVVISLPSALERRAVMTERLAALGLPFRWFDAIDARGTDVGAQPIYDGRRRRLFFGRDLTGGEIGCLLSHRAVIEQAAAGDRPLLVLEDDAILHEGTVAVLRALMADQSDWELVRFLGSPKVARSRQRRLRNLGGGFWLTRLLTTPGGAHAYLIRPEGARKLLRRLARTAFPVDTLMGQSWRTGVANLTVQPGIAVSDEAMESSIGDQRFDKRLTVSGWERVLMPLARSRWKVEENLGKHGIYWSRWPADAARRGRAKPGRALREAQG